MSTKIGKNLPAQSGKTKEEVRTEWFGDLIHKFALTRDLMNDNMASGETTKIYDDAIFGTGIEMAKSTRQLTSRYFIGKLVGDYFQELSELKVNVEKLFVDHNDSQLFVWAEINDDDETTERALLKAEAKANALNYQFGFHISSTIVEKSENFKVPPHYFNALTAS